MYVEGMAPRVDKLDAFLSGESPRYQYIVMRAYARGLEIDLRELRLNSLPKHEPCVRRVETPERPNGHHLSESTCERPATMTGQHLPD